MEHRYFDKIATIVGLVLTAVGGFNLGSWHTSTSKTSGDNSPSVSGDHNNVSTTTINNTTINKTVIVNSKPATRAAHGNVNEDNFDDCFRYWEIRSLGV